MRISAVFLVCVLMTAPALAQESRLAAEFRLEGEDLKESCGGLSKIAGCATTLATDQPVHIAFGSIAPQNGFGFGAAFVAHLTPNENWRINWSADAVGALSGAWRAGAYMKMVRTGVVLPTVAPAGSGSSGGAIGAYPILNAYVQLISLPTVSFFGLGPGSTREAQSVFGMRQAIVGANTIVPINRMGRLNLSLLGEANGRFVRLRGAPGEDTPSIEQLYNDATAPGLSNQPGFLQLGEGVRIKPSFLNGHARLNYMAQLQQFVAPSDSTYSFHRWTVDLGHEFPIYGTSVPTARDTNGPNECAIDPKDRKCPISRNRTGAVGLRFLVSRAGASGESVVPFYFQETLGGSDINGNRLLPSYDDYRFRGPRLLVVQESFEHSLGSWPVGIWVGADQGKVELQDGTSGDFLYSYGAGLTLRAGGFPAVFLTWATGGTEGHHIAFTISTSLLGGSSRPSLQ
jgi:hypothetical protein